MKIQTWHLVYLSLYVSKLAISESKNKKLMLHFFHENHGKNSKNNYKKIGILIFFTLLGEIIIKI